jgi:hypothetical protein
VSSRAGLELPVEPPAVGEGERVTDEPATLDDAAFG